MNKVIGQNKDNHLEVSSSGDLMSILGLERLTCGPGVNLAEKHFDINTDARIHRLDRAAASRRQLSAITQGSD